MVKSKGHAQIVEQVDMMMNDTQHFLNVESEELISNQLSIGKR